MSLRISCVRVCMYVCACVRACVRGVRVCVCVCVCVWCVCVPVHTLVCVSAYFPRPEVSDPVR